MKFLALSPCDSEPEKPLITTISADEMPEEPDDFTSTPPPTLEEKEQGYEKPAYKEQAYEYPSGGWPV